MSQPLVRRATVDDASALAQIMGDPAVYPQLMQMPYASASVWRERLQEMGAAGKSDLLLVAELHGAVVGSAGLHPVGPQMRRRHAWMLGISVAQPAQGQGVGTALMQALCDYADNWIGALRLELDVYCDNVPALALYRKFGFEVEGTQKNYALRNGEYVDSHPMVRFHPRPPGLRS